MVRHRDADINSKLIVSEVRNRPCLYDTNHPNYGDRAEKIRAWEELYRIVVPGWCSMSCEDKFAAGKEVQKRWRSIRDSYTKAFRQGKCMLPEQCPPGSRRYQHHKQMSFLLLALQNKKPRYSQERYESSLSEMSNSPQHPPPEDVKIRTDVASVKVKTEKPDTHDKSNQASIDKEPILKNPSLEIKIDANSILPDDHFDDDKQFMNSLLPFFKKMDDSTRLLCRIEVLKIIRYALQKDKCFEALRVAEDNFFQNKISEILTKKNGETNVSRSESTLSMTTRSADGSRPLRKRQSHSPSPTPTPPKRRGPGRPRKIRPPSDSEEDRQPKKRTPKLKVSPIEVPKISEIDESLSKVTSVMQLSTPMFMKIYNLERSKNAPVIVTPQTPQSMQVSIKSEPGEGLQST